ncbi:MAG: ATP phosphoribosyltransferase regulatory subunit [Nanoarchaeota archaeon]
MSTPIFEVAKGHRDSSGREAILRNKVRDTLRGIFERYGYNPLETPMIENAETISFKGGGEIKKEVYRLSDQGGRDLALRFDQTLPFARFLATNPDVKFPFKRYVMGPVFRDGPTQPEQGRFRSFTQCDVDVAGVKGMAAEAELLALAQDSFGALGLGGVDVKINNRKLLYGVLDYAGVPDNAKLRTIITLDKMDKLGVDEMVENLERLTLTDEAMGISNETLRELDSLAKKSSFVGAVENLRHKIVAEVGTLGYHEVNQIAINDSVDYDDRIRLVGDFKTKGERLLTSDSVARLMELVKSGGNNEETFARLKANVTSPRGLEGLNEVRQLLDYSKGMGFDFISLDPSLARGLDYYTGTTIEVFLKDRSTVKSAILGGGRFDDMLGDYRGRGEEIPAVGFSFVLERLVMILDKNADSPSNVTQLYLIPMNTTAQSLKIAHQLRQEGVNVDIDLVGGRKLGNVISSVSSLGIPYVGIIGEDEVREGVLTVKNLRTREQNKVPISDVPKYLSMGRQLKT